MCVRVSQTWHTREQHESDRAVSSKQVQTFLFHYDLISPHCLNGGCSSLLFFFFFSLLHSVRLHFLSTSSWSDPRKEGKKERKKKTTNKNRTNNKQSRQGEAGKQRNMTDFRALLLLSLIRFLFLHCPSAKKRRITEPMKKLFPGKSSSFSHAWSHWLAGMVSVTDPLAL